MMGSEDGDPDEKPVHLVELTWPFWIGAHEVRIASILAWLNSPGVIVEKDWICQEMDSTEPPDQMERRSIRSESAIPVRPV
jgi:formylglycine-generating enzyme required for sulfatase activity